MKILEFSTVEIFFFIGIKWISRLEFFNMIYNRLFAYNTPSYIFHGIIGILMLWERERKERGVNWKGNFLLCFINLEFQTKIIIFIWKFYKYVWLYFFFFFNSFSFEIRLKKIKKRSCPKNIRIFFKEINFKIAWFLWQVTGFNIFLENVNCF